MTLHNPSELDYTSIMFANNEVQYKDTHNMTRYLHIEIARGKVLSVGDDMVWIELQDRSADIISRIDVEFVSRSSKSLRDYFVRMSAIGGSLVPSISGKYVVCPVHTRSYTKYGDAPATIVAGTIVKILLSANYNKTGLIWNALLLQRHNNTSDINDILQECLLETEVVEVIKI